jgi:hypothetical protein
MVENNADFDHLPPVGLKRYQIALFVNLPERVFNGLPLP